MKGKAMSKCCRCSDEQPVVYEERLGTRFYYCSFCWLAKAKSKPSAHRSNLFDRDKVTKV